MLRRRGGEWWGINLTDDGNDDATSYYEHQQHNTRPKEGKQKKQLRPDEGSLYSVVLVTCPARASRKISRAILDGRLAACVSIIRQVESLFLWKGKIEDADECLLLIKTRTSKLDDLERVVKVVHPYDVPEIVALPIAGGYRPYLDWIDESVDK
jgi:periplasmic divalent cation tolerance protein